MWAQGLLLRWMPQHLTSPWGGTQDLWLKGVWTPDSPLWPFCARRCCLLWREAEARGSGLAASGCLSERGLQTGQPGGQPGAQSGVPCGQRAGTQRAHAYRREKAT